VSVGARVGDVLASKYRLEELLGSGGMGDVYRAVNVEIDRAVAIKVLRREHAENAHVVERFLREARAANLVRHPNVVDVVDVGRDGDGSPFIVQELLRGEDLSKYVERRGGRLSLDDLRELVLPLIDAVAEAHSRGVVHRDIKPENVFIAEQGTRRVPKLLDFGISKVRLPNVKATEVGVMMGTPAYMAPEQVTRSHEADPRTDVWALGVMLFELVSGRLPFDAVDAPALFVAIATRDAPSLAEVVPEVSLRLAKVVDRCVRRAAAERYPSALELARDLGHVLDGDEIEPTQRRSVRPPPAPPAFRLEVPDLEQLPLPRRPASTTQKGPPPSPATLNKTELAIEQPLAPPPRSPPAIAAPRLVLAATPPQHGPRPAAHVALRPRSARAHAAGASDMTHLVALAAVALTALGVTAALMTFAYRPEGWPLVSFFTGPTPTTNLVVNGGLALVGFVLAAQSGANGVKRWRGSVAGGRGAALVQAALAGGFLFAALQLARAAY
jgi:serine/threonine-protein kinase